MDWATQQQQDDDAIQGLFADPTHAPEINLEGPIDQSGKADDAEDFEDFSDDELPEEEEEGGANGTSEQPPALTSDGGTSNDIDDDLFGERESSPMQVEPAMSPGAAIADVDQQDIEMGGGDDLADLRRLNFDPEPSYPMANQDPNIPSAPENVLELLKQTYPEFERGKILNFNELFPPRKANWVDKKPTRNPKPLIPTKLSLEVDIGQEKSFMKPGPASATTAEKIQAAEKEGLVSLLKPEPINEDELEIFGRDDPDSDQELIGGFTLRDIETVCEDWDDIIDPATPTFHQASPAAEDEEDHQWYLDMGLAPPKPKRRKISHAKGLPEISWFAAPSFDDFEEATARSAKRVRLDLNDPYLLIDDNEAERPAKRPRPSSKMVRMADGKVASDITQRFDISNDDAYEALKENVRDKVRATLGGVQVEHSVPARKLLYPYYMVKLSDPTPFNYHRPSLRVRRQVGAKLNWAKPRHHRRKDFKSSRVSDVYKASRDLSLNDNSTAVLFEYCEEIPTVLSNFGMGSKIVNYFRVNHDPEDKPTDKLALGETKILLPEDRSPFANFGDVPKGQTVPTLWNHMYRAPIFKHEPRKTDFIIGRITDDNESKYYMRSIDHIYVVGQNFPSVEVPGPHSRKVTNTSKNRMKMLAYRFITKHGFLSLEDITTHIAESNIAQNRQKLREFLQYDKDARTWSLREGEKLMDPDSINSMVQPEDVCLMDAMQVGAYEVEKAGFAIDQADLDKDDDDGTGATENIAVQLSPWKTTKAFLDATSGKAMLKLRGEGDPTGRGLGFSFIKTSMKGGFLNVYHEQGPQSTSADALEREKKANGGHSYNVKKQNDAYAEVIADIWNKQQRTLSDTQIHDDADVAPQEDEDERLYANAANGSFQAHVNGVGATPRFDEGVSQISRSATSAARAAMRRRLKIVRTIREPDGTEKDVEEIIEDPGIIKEYTARRNAIQEAEVDIFAGFTGDEEHDRIPSIEKGGTTRKCANCGMVGHIKTNKKLCPVLNGSMGSKPAGEDTTGTYGES
ncbi:hypothetical protein M406DRAFT_91625 [Cryphonectria parasitica EP155]|uniref:Transcription initiation factor TFIID subunit 1 histone acetyltransferase domain-containing protein n=1 Tax=Cryphonectria parasitica (strain ATCC 38755 / EP155) TaxID=660469 RepID=A0A9P5CNH9_CRYP1|nr:uncharacterized protein M406DRAFT_91625 [Cryphonectria parasitica EP155]KAF3764342.1 hypothetical protein M406DRAFT_91625 [Cryphonectria parasitica EP155]